MANKSNKKVPKSTTHGRPPNRKKAKVSPPIVESAKDHPRPRPRPPPKKSFEDEADSPGNNGDGKDSHGDEVYAASVALLGLAQGDGMKSSRAGSKNGDENDEMEIVADDVDGGSVQEADEDEDAEPSS